MKFLMIGNEEQAKNNAIEEENWKNWKCWALPS